MEYQLIVNDEYVKLMHKAVSKYLETWPGGDPLDQEKMMTMKLHLDKLLLEAVFDTL